MSGMVVITSYRYTHFLGGGFKMFKKPSFLMGFGESIDIITVRFPKTKKNMEFSGVLTRSEGTSGRVSYIPLPKN